MGVTSSCAPRTCRCLSVRIAPTRLSRQRRTLSTRISMRAATCTLSTWSTAWAPASRPPRRLWRRRAHTVRRLRVVATAPTSQAPSPTLTRRCRCRHPHHRHRPRSHRRRCRPLRWVATRLRRLVPRHHRLRRLRLHCLHRHCHRPARLHRRRCRRPHRRFCRRHRWRPRRQEATRLRRLLLRRPRRRLQWHHLRRRCRHHRRSGSAT